MMIEANCFQNRVTLFDLHEACMLHFLCGIWYMLHCNNIAIFRTKICLALFELYISVLILSLVYLQSAD